MPSPSISSDEIVNKLAGALMLPAGANEAARLYSVSELRRVDPGTIVQRFGEPASGLLFLVRGLLELRRDLSNGHKFLYNLVFPGNLADPTSALDGQPSPFDFVATEASSLLQVPVKALHEMIDASAAVRHAIRQHMCFARRLNFVRIGATAFLSPRSKITRLLVYWARFLTKNQMLAVEMPLSLTQEDIGAFWGLSRSTVNKEFAALAREGVVEVRYCGLAILDPIRLCEIAASEEPFDFFENAMFVPDMPSSCDPAHGDSLAAKPVKPR